MFEKIKKRFKDMAINFNKNILYDTFNSGVSTINDTVSELESKLTKDIQLINEDIESLSIYAENFKVKLKNLSQKEENDISGLNKKTELLFKQIDSTNRLIYSYVQEQLFNIEKVRLEMKRENLMHYINEEITEKRIMWISALPWYKKITKKQQIRLIVKMKEIQDDVYKKYDIQLKAIDLEIKNHTRENFSLKLTNVTKEIKNNQKGEK